MRIRRQEMQRLSTLTAILAVGLVIQITHAEFKVGEKLPALTLPATDGVQVELAMRDGSLILKQAAIETKPAAVVIHLLQPDCLQCRAQLNELQALNDRFHARGVAVLGIAHRGVMKQLQQLGKDLGVKFPLIHGVGSNIAQQFAAGDTLGIADKSGIIQYAQVGFGKGDEVLWASALEEILAGKAVTNSTTTRERLAVGDRFPTVELPSIQTGKPIALMGKNGRLIFRDDQGKETQPKAAVGFFSRY